jgi:type IV pilus assembly protein PilA
VATLILGVLMLIGLPTLLGTKERAQDRRTQANIRNAFEAEKAYYADARVYTDVPADMAGIEPSLDYVAGDTPAAVGTIYLLWDPGTDEIFISARSESGSCFYLKEAAASGAQYATAADPACGAADTQTYGDSW